MRVNRLHRERERERDQRERERSERGRANRKGSHLTCTKCLEDTEVSFPR